MISYQRFGQYLNFAHLQYHGRGRPRGRGRGAYSQPAPVTLSHPVARTYPERGRGMRGRGMARGRGGPVRNERSYVMPQPYSRPPSTQVTRPQYFSPTSTTTTFRDPTPSPTLSTSSPPNLKIIVQNDSNPNVERPKKATKPKKQQVELQEEVNLHSLTTEDIIKLKELLHNPQQHLAPSPVATTTTSTRLNTQPLIRGPDFAPPQQQEATTLDSLFARIRGNSEY